MKKYFIQNKPFLLFLGKFLLTYVLLTFVYESYLNNFDSKKFETDGFTQFVAQQTVDLLSFFKFNAYSAINYFESSVKLIYNNKFIARVVEGCNGLSVIILFISFIIAFTGKLKYTLIYILVGVLIIHVLNVARIALLCILLFKYPESESLLHGVIFPLIIYGAVFLLWIIWVNNYSIYAKKSLQK